MSGGNGYPASQWYYSLQVVVVMVFSLGGQQGDIGAISQSNQHNREQEVMRWKILHTQGVQGMQQICIQEYAEIAEYATDLYTGMCREDRYATDMYVYRNMLGAQCIQYMYSNM